MSDLKRKGQDPFALTMMGTVISRAEDICVGIGVWGLFLVFYYSATILIGYEKVILQLKSNR